MAFEPLRFIHASDFHLGRALRGLAEVPDHLRDLLTDASYVAATRVFDAAISNHVDFLALAGDIFNFVESGPRGYAFLCSQFERLAQRSISVYWAGGRMEIPEQAQPPVNWPNNVTIFPFDRPMTVVHMRDEQPIAKIVGLSYALKRKIRPADFGSADPVLPTVAIVFGKIDGDVLSEEGPSFWALGSEHAFRSVAAGRPTAAYSGNAQASSTSDLGMNSCTLVQIALGATPRLMQIPTDVVRCLSEQLFAEPLTTAASLEAQLRERMESLAKQDTNLLVRWTVSGTSDVLERLAREVDVDSTLGRLREEFGRRKPCAWITSIEFDEPPLPHAWYEEDTILGDFLRTLRQHEQEGTYPDLGTLLSERNAVGEIGEAVAIGDRQRMQQVLRRSAQLGSRLLRGEEPRS